MVPHSRKYWRELNSADWPQLALTLNLVDFNLADSTAGIRCAQCQYLILADFNLAVGVSICQTAKLNSSPNFPAIRYAIRSESE